MTNAHAQTGVSRLEIETFDREFAQLHSRNLALIAGTPLDLLYRSRPSAESVSIGETVLRSAAAVEQAFGGITANLWDDPFEWTLPDYLSTHERIIEYLEEVETTRRRAFDSFSQDSDLLKQIAAPSGATQSLLSLLVATLVKATDIHGRAQEMRELLDEVCSGPAR